MKTDTLVITQNQQSLKKGRFWYTLAGILLIISLVSQQPLALLAALFALALAIIPQYWYRYALRHLTVRQQTQSHPHFFGEELALTLDIENLKALPLPWVRVEVAISPPLTVRVGETARREKISYFAQTWMLWSFERVIRQYRMHCHARGVYTLGPIKLRSSDPLGWLECDAVASARETLIVYPLIAPIEAFHFPALRPSGQETTRRHLLEDPLRVVGVRDYQLGDELRRIHWKASAHSGTLQSKVYEYGGLRRLLLVLDTADPPGSWAGIDPELHELCITAAASLAVWALDEGYAVGLLANSKSIPLDLSRESFPGIHIPFASDQAQYARLLSVLASFVAYDSSPIEQIMDEADAMFVPGTTVVFISTLTALNANAVERLWEHQARSITALIALAGEPGEKIATETHDLPVHRLGGREQWYELIQSFRDEKDGTHPSGPHAFQLD
jgi:uncharacterized protein (DUF58 family)